MVVAVKMSSVSPWAAGTAQPPCSAGYISAGGWLLPKVLSSIWLSSHSAVPCTFALLDFTLVHWSRRCEGWLLPLTCPGAPIAWLPKAVRAPRGALHGQREQDVLSAQGCAVPNPIDAVRHQEILTWPNKNSAAWATEMQPLLHSRKLSGSAGENQSPGAALQLCKVSAKGEQKAEKWEGKGAWSSAPWLLLCAVTWARSCPSCHGELRLSGEIQQSPTYEEGTSLKHVKNVF